MKIYNVNTVKIFLLAVGIIFMPEIVLASSADKKAMEGMELYRKKVFDQASQKFLEAHNGKPKDPKISYNLGNSHYKQGKFEKALNNYSNLLDLKTDTSIKQKTAYNTGNTLYRMGKFEESILSYKKALKLDPNDMDAKFNLEFVRKKNKEKQAEQQKKNKSEKDKKDQDPDNQKNQNQKNNENSQQDQNKKEASNIQKTPQNKQEKNNEQNRASIESQALQESISKEEAEQKLSSLTEDLKKFQRKQALDMKSLFNYQGNDW